MRDSRGYSVHIVGKVNAADPENVAVQLAKYCIAHDISSARVAADLGTSKQSVYAWFTGQRRPRARTVERLVALLDTYKAAAAV